MQVLEDYLDIHEATFQMEGAMTEWMMVWVRFLPSVTVDSQPQE